jgi:cysteinyl-tRNA synthetase
VLWKSAKPDEPSWESPWGNGRPGWHIECSAMSTQCLGNHFDIHGGGMDLKFPHHENEIAQSEAATGEPFVNLWMHNGFVKVDEEKMSKSLGNFFTVREILKNYEAEDVRYFILASHYRSPLNYTQVNLDNSKAALTRLYTALYGLSPANSAADNQYTQAFHAAMSDDFNTPEAIKVLFDIAHEINRSREHDSTRANELTGCLVTLGGVLGLLQEDPEVRRQGKSEIYAKTAELEITPHKASISILSKEEIDGIIEKRRKAREEKNWSESDRIRDELAAQGIVLEDSASGTSWRRK